MPNRFVTVSLLMLALTFTVSAQKKMAKTSAPNAPDRAYLQKIWDGWATLDPANVAKYYATGPHTFYDIAPLKYNSWDEYQKGVVAVVANYKSAKFTINDDLAIHPHSDLVWATATIAEEMTTKAGKVEMGNFRWTAVLENEDGKWLIVHEHVSAPLS
ncbi:MAG: nuclear transport factor 2 family protein [Candidatus Sulfotelmatobacter sp.]